jgi:hypothetical protein
MSEKSSTFAAQNVRKAKETRKVILRYGRRKVYKHINVYQGIAGTD